MASNFTVRQQARPLEQLSGEYPICYNYLSLG